VVDKETKMVKWNPLWQRLSHPVGDKLGTKRQTIKIKRFVIHQMLFRKSIAMHKGSPVHIAMATGRESESCRFES